MKVSGTTKGSNLGEIHRTHEKVALPQWTGGRIYPVWYEPHDFIPTEGKSGYLVHRWKLP